MANFSDYVSVAEDVIEGIEELSLYWDAKGLDLHMAVKKLDDRNVVIAVKTKHWARVNYLQTSVDTGDEAWLMLGALAKKVSRTLVVSKKGPYVCIPKLSEKQTENVFNHLRQVIEEWTGESPQLTRAWEIAWEIEDAVPPPHSEWA